MDVLSLRQEASIEMRILHDHCQDLIQNLQFPVLS